MLSRLFKNLWRRFKDWAIEDDAAILAANLKTIQAENEERRKNNEAEATRRRVQDAIYKKQREMKDVIRTTKNQRPPDPPMPRTVARPVAPPRPIPRVAPRTSRTTQMPYTNPIDYHSDPSLDLLSTALILDSLHHHHAEQNMIISDDSFGERNGNFGGGGASGTWEEPVRTPEPTRYEPEPEPTRYESVCSPDPEPSSDCSSDYSSNE